MEFIVSKSKEDIYLYIYVLFFFFKVQSRYYGGIAGSDFRC